MRGAQDFMNRAGIRIIRLPLGELALAYPPRTDMDELRWAARVLRMDSMPLVINDEELEWISPDPVVCPRWQIARLPRAGCGQAADRGRLREAVVWA